MHTTVSQNKAHKSDMVWAKTSKGVTFGGERYQSEYTNLFTGQTIRKDWRMTGRDWVVFNAAGVITHRAHSLTWAKMDAAA